jgi:hypothetical protein
MSSDDYINGWELGGICSTHIANESQVYLQSFLVVEKGRNHVEGLCAGGRIILKCTLKKWWGGGG